jgi:CheY-like chemotaxis protein/HPt (histidine-containing phosphotransfer) domain-containing protein
MREHPEHVGATVMMLTSEGQRGHAVRCRELGVVGYLMKPVSQSELLDAIMTALGEPQKQTPHLITRHSLRETQRKLDLLLAEDNAVNQTLAVRLLEKLGHRVTVANNGIEAVKHWQNGHFDAILMDVDMPEMNGYQATERIRALEQSTGQHIPIVAMTAHAMQGAQEECLRHGMDAYLTKPIDTEALWAQLDALAQRAPVKPVAAAITQPRINVVADLAKARKNMNDDRELFDEIVKVFFEDAPVQMQHIREAFEQSNVEVVRRGGHTMKGMVSVFSAEPSRLAALSVEQTAGKAGSQAAIEHLDSVLSELLAFLKIYQW